MKSIDTSEVATPLDFINLAPMGITVVDVGCYGWLLAGVCAIKGNRYVGIDRCEPPGKPAGAEFNTMAGHLLNLQSDTADFIVAAHVIEHLHTPVEFVVELARVTRAGGHIFLETPSELSARPRSSDDVQDQRFDSFWDDPTHVRPYTPAALYRLAISAGLIPKIVKRGISGRIPTTYMLAQVPFSGSSGSRYVTLKDVPYGLVSAMATIWPEKSVCAEDEARLSKAFSTQKKDENRRLKKMYAEEKLKAEIISEAMQKKW